MNDGGPATRELTQQERATNAETWKHINRVQQLMLGLASELIARAARHDQSKLVLPEVEGFAKHTESLRGMTYKSPEYEAAMKDMAATIEHHYANNSHHPQHFPNGVNGMDILDLVEMLCDWRAAGERHADGSMDKSLEINGPRFDIAPQLIEVFRNSAKRWATASRPGGAT